MAERGTIIRAAAFVLLTGVLAAAIVTTLLAVGVEPHLVFTPGFVIQSWCASLGIPVPKAVGVIGTVFAYWCVVVGVRFIVIRMTRHS